MRALLAFDGSDGAEDAAALLATLAWPSGSAVRVVAVVEPSMTLMPGGPYAPNRLIASPEIEAQIVGHLEAEVGRVVNDLRSAGLEAAGDVVRGRPGSILIEEAERFEADVLVAGSRGHGPIASLVLGSVSAELVDHASCPVLVTRNRAVERILFATDGSAAAGEAGEVLAGMTIFAGATIRVLSVAEVVRPWHTGIAPTMYRQVIDAYAEDLEVAKREHEAVARAAGERLEAAGRAVDVEVRVGDAAVEILEEAAAWGADLIVMGSRGLTGLKRLVLGSVARNVLQGSPGSVLIAHGRPEAATDRPSA